MSSFLQKIQNVTTFVFDVDGVFTDSSLLITESGELLRKMNVRDGYAIKMAIEAGYNIAIITGGSSEGVIKRLNGLGIKEIHSKIKDKLTVLNTFLADHKLSIDEILYMGDDEIDVPCLKVAGTSVCPKDADPCTHPHVDYICQKQGGSGCVREIVQMVMEAQGKWKSFS